MIQRMAALMTVVVASACGTPYIGDATYPSKAVMFRLFVYESVELFRHETGRWPVSSKELVEHFKDDAYFVYATPEPAGPGIVYHVQRVCDRDFDLEPVAVAPAEASYVVEGFGWKEAIRVEYRGAGRGLSNRKFPVGAGLAHETIVLSWTAGCALVIALVLELVSLLSVGVRLADSKRWKWFVPAVWAVFVLAASALRATQPLMSYADLALYIAGLSGVAIAAHSVATRLRTTGSTDSGEDGE